MNTEVQMAGFTVAYGCVLIAALLPMLCALLAKGGSFHGADNHDPRAWLARQAGWRARANAAQANSFEALPFFIGAVIIAHQLGAPQATLDLLACAFIVLRLGYIGLYVADRPTARSLVWGLALLVNIAILLLAWR
ncbi:MAG: MAPEG family protein [Proteobacteria bacterium]|nr:MAPEG family protein [Pseudomonadota bacterium]MBS0608636.1 MAPEG family protein [Pseudomonadota bacterium]